MKIENILDDNYVVSISIIAFDLNNYKINAAYNIDSNVKNTMNDYILFDFLRMIDLFNHIIDHSILINYSL